MNIGTLVIKNEKYGIVTRQYENWQDLKEKNEFVTIFPDHEKKDYDNIELMINDPRDSWLEMQNYKYSRCEIEDMSWVSIIHFSVEDYFPYQDLNAWPHGGSSWSPINRVIVILPLTLN